MTKVALLGAGGKMGLRLASNLKTSRFSVDHIEISEAGRARLKQEVGVDAVPGDNAVADADVVLLAVPDRAIGAVAGGLIEKVKPGAALIVLDAAAPHAGRMPERADVTYFCSHPCHPALFDFTSDIDVQKDFFGGVHAPQGIVCALIQGPEAHYALCEEVARTIYAPVTRSYRCTLEQIAILEPALSETVGATLALALREACDRAVQMGVPPDAARDFMLGHLKIELGIAFEIFPGGKFSDGALHAIEQAKPLIFKDNWLDAVFDREAIEKSVRDICSPGSDK